MEKEFLFRKMEINMMKNGDKIRNLEKDNSNMQIAKNIMVN